MVRELIAAGLTGPELLLEVQRLSGLPPADATLLISIQGGRLASPPLPSIFDFADLADAARSTVRHAV
jgi:hypothetical protein